MTTTVDFAPGLYLDMPADTYHADPVPGGSLSSSGARRLLPPGCPRLFKYEQETKLATRRVFEIGHAAHALVLGTGPELVRISEQEWRKDAVKEEVAEARERGAVPLRPSEWDELHAMADALRQHSIAGSLLAMQGHAEASIFWQEYGIWRRARLDWLARYVADYKTAETVEPTALERVMHRYGLHQQGAWYLDAARAIGHEATKFLLIFQEKTPPYLVTVAEPDHKAIEIGRRLNRQAIEVYRRCMETGRWPSYPLPYVDAHADEEIAYLALPAWVEAQYREGAR